MELIVRQMSGLGNQMFQYAAGLFYASQHGAQLKLGIEPPDKSFSHGHPRPFLLPYLAISARYREFSNIDRLFLFAGRATLKATVGQLLRKTLRVDIITERLDQRFRFQPKLPIASDARSVYLVGYWQVHNIAEKISNNLRKEFAFRDPPAGRNLEMLRLIHNTENAVAIHVRRGDYTLEIEGNIALPIGYYNRAVAQLTESLNNPTFFVFSDDIEFARQNLPQTIHAVFIDHNDAFSAHEDLRLMSACQHHIIANSTFSWWGAWLNSNTSRIVIAPRNWRVANCPATNDLLPPSWRLLE